jgi:hypothetical protein
VQRPASRCQTARRIAAGMCRDGVSLGDGEVRADRGAAVSANFCLRTCLSKLAFGTPWNGSRAPFSGSTCDFRGQNPNNPRTGQRGASQWKLETDLGQRPLEPQKTVKGFARIFSASELDSNPVARTLGPERMSRGSCSQAGYRSSGGTAIRRPSISKQWPPRSGISAHAGTPDEPSHGNPPRC